MGRWAAPRRWQVSRGSDSGGSTAGAALRSLREAGRPGGLGEASGAACGSLRLDSASAAPEDADGGRPAGPGAAERSPPSSEL